MADGLNLSRFLELGEGDFDGCAGRSPDSPRAQKSWVTKPTKGAKDTKLDHLTFATLLEQGGVEGHQHDRARD